MLPVDPSSNELSPYHLQKGKKERKKGTTD